MTDSDFDFLVASRITKKMIQSVTEQEVPGVSGEALNATCHFSFPSLVVFSKMIFSYLQELLSLNLSV